MNPPSFVASSPDRRRGPLAVLLLGLAAAAPAAAVSWERSLPPGASTDAQVVDFASVNGVRWLLLQRGDQITLQRESGGQTLLAATTAISSRLIGLPDGGVLLNEGAQRRVRRYDAQAQLVWQRDVAPLQILVDASGGSWIETLDDIQRIAPDGSQRVVLRPTAQAVVARTVAAEPAPLRYQRAQRAVDAASGDLLVAGNSRINPSEGVARLARFDRSGNLRWEWTDTGGALGIEFSAVATAPDGTSCAAGRVPNGTRVLRLCYGADGQLRWSSPQELGPDSSTVLLAVAADRSVYALDTINRSSARLVRLSAEGSTLWTQPLPAGVNDACTAPGPSCSLRVEANGEATVLTAINAANPRQRLVSYDRNGQLRFDRELPVSAVTTLTRDAAGHHFGVGTREAGLRRLFELDAQGGLVDDDVPLQAPQLTPARAVAAGAGGETYVVSAADDAANYFLSRFGADGTLSWRREFAGGLDQAIAVASGDRVCIAETEVVNAEPNNRVRCVAGADGSTLWLRAIEAPINYRSRDPLPPSVFRLRPDNGLVLAYLYYGAQVYTATGLSQLRVRTNEATPLADINSADDSLVVERVANQPAGSDAGRLILRTASDRVVYSLDLVAIGIQPQQLRLGDDENAFIVGTETQGASDVYVWRLENDGSVRWKRRLDRLDQGSPRLYLTADSILIERRSGASGVDAEVALEVLRRENGNRRWRQRFAADQADLDAQNNQAVLFAAGQGRWKVRSFDLLDGSEQAAATYACAAEDCRFGGAVAAAGIAHFAASDRAGAQSYLPRPPIRVDQAGIAGAWGTHYGEGEGLVLDWLPQARLLYMPWFTYARDGGNASGQLRWFVAQAANVPNGALSAPMEIYEVTGGQFDAAAPRVVRLAGTATLEFSDCANARLSYRFDSNYNGGASGALTLSRLSPATSPCVLADGSVQPAPAARPPTKGFDARQSGSWYEPATGGQGMQLTVQPDGVFFGAWFTYDVADAADDNGKQHWLTLYGNLAQAVNGRIDLAVVQTVGGAFDRVPTRNRYIVGQATLQMQGCDRATLSYRFDQGELVGAFAGRSGEIELIKEGGCAP